MIEVLIHLVLTRYEYRGRLSKTIHVGVGCEACGQKYGYALTRSVEVKVSRVVWESRTTARRAARRHAETYLDRKLDQQSDAVPCPVCGWLQMQMLDAARREQFPHRPRNAVVALILAGVALLATFIVQLVQDARPRLELGGVLWGLGLTMAMLGGGGIVSLIIHDRRVKTYDPNAIPVEDRIEWGRNRAMTWEEFEELYPEEDDDAEDEE
jgi:hypothetical protein